MNIKLFFQAIIKFALGIILAGALLFVPAGTFAYWNAWLFLGILFIPMFILGAVMMIKSPELLKKRLNTKETESVQKYVIILSLLLFVSGFIIAGLNFRYSWIVLPNVVSIIASIVFVISYILYAEVLRENAYLSRVVEVQENQKVISTGLYGVVRHPMYAVTVFLFLSMMLVLGSVISFGIFLIYPFIIAKRISNEEKVLEEKLEGYIEYKNKVKYKMIPFVW